MRASAAVLLAAVLSAPAALPADNDADADADADAGARVYYDEGLHLKSADGYWTANPQLRGQFRYSNLDGEIDGAGPDDLLRDESSFDLKRARFKMGGTAYRPWLGYYTEIDLTEPRLLDLRVDLQLSPALGFRIGQYKALYNRERIDSSGKQQFVERSVVTYPFTVDRQQGATVLGRLFADSAVDSNYFIGLFRGTGRGGGSDDDDQPMWVGRWQWNLLRRELGFSQSDLARTSKPAATLAFAAASNRSRFTRFSSNGGGQLTGFEAGESGQYDTRQWMGEFAFKSRGWSIQAEYHQKSVEDRLNNTDTDLSGFYAQTGYFLNAAFTRVPAALEFALRYAWVDSRGDIPQPQQREASLVGNWFFAGHRNKLSADLSRLSETESGFSDSGWRFRLQWDVSL